MVSTHMDDYKATGKHVTLRWLHEILKRHFGEVSLSIDKGSFVHTGIKPQILKDEILLEQYEYASALEPVPAAAMANFKDTDSLDEKLHACFLTLLGAAAWLLQTRLDIMGYVSSLQRMSKKPTIAELNRINR